MTSALSDYHADQVRWWEGSKQKGKKMYKPTPINTDGVELPASVNPLIEELAASGHDVWAQQRMGEGWTFGPERNDADKKHPCLVPYADLPEAEKEYDRITAAAALKSIVALGYKIVPA